MSRPPAREANAAVEGEGTSGGRRPPGRARLAFRVAVRTVLVLLATTILPVAIHRWVPVPSSAVMMQERLVRLLDGRGVRLRHEWNSWEEIAPAMALAAIAAEDQRFATHRGFDVRAIEDALEERARQGRVRGASTISQQVAKNLFLWRARSWFRKGLEAYYTALIELLWPKRRILEVYLNVVELGDGVYGVGAAAEAHFGTSARRLSARQAALLAAVLPSPRRWSASSPGPYVQRRASWIQRQMRQLGGVAHLEAL